MNNCYRWSKLQSYNRTFQNYKRSRDERTIPAKSPDTLRAMVAGTLANFQHPTLKHNLTTLKALHHVARMDDTLHVELVMPFVWNSAFEVLKEQCSADLLRITGAKAIDWKLSYNIATLKRVKNQPALMA